MGIPGFWAVRSSITFLLTGGLIVSPVGRWCWGTAVSHRDGRTTGTLRRTQLSQAPSHRHRYKACAAFVVKPILTVIKSRPAHLEAVMMCTVYSTLRRQRSGSSWEVRAFKCGCQRLSKHVAARSSLSKSPLSHSPRMHNLFRAPGPLCPRSHLPRCHPPRPIHFSRMRLPRCRPRQSLTPPVGPGGRTRTATSSRARLMSSPARPQTSDEASDG